MTATLNLWHTAGGGKKPKRERIQFTEAMQTSRGLLFLFTKIREFCVFIDRWMKEWEIPEKTTEEATPISNMDWDKKPR